MPSKLLSLAAVACLSAALASCGSGSAELAESEGGELPGQEEAGWERAIDNLNTAKKLANETIKLATATPSATAIKRARDAADAYVEAAEAAVAAAGGADRQAIARRELSAAQSGRDASQRRLNALRETLDESPGSSGGGSGGSPGSRVRSLLTDLDARSLTHFERGYTFLSADGSALLTNVNPCSESSGVCNFGSGVRYNAGQYLGPDFISTFSPSLTIASLSAAPINGVEAFSAFEDYDGPAIGPGRVGPSWTLLAAGKYSAARLDIAGTGHHYGLALGERHAGRPSDPSGGSATWRGQMIGAAMDNASPLAGESALTYSFGDNTVDVRISGIRAVGDASYTGGASLTWTGLAVNSDGSFYIPGYNNDRSGVTLSSALHPTLGYIDGDFYGPNAEEAAGIFTRSNVNGAFVAGSSGRRTSADDETPSDGGQTPSSEETPSEGGQPPSEEETPTEDGQTEQGGSGGGSGGNAGSRVRSLLTDLDARSLTHFERGYTFLSADGSALLTNVNPCSESSGVCNFGSGVRYNAGQYLGPEFIDAFHPLHPTVASLSTPINGVESFYARDLHGSWVLLAAGKYSTARLDIASTGHHHSVALGERHGRPNGASGSATWRGQMVGAAMDNASPLAGESALTYSFGDNTVDVRISSIRAVGDASYTGSTSLTWTDLAVNSDGSFYISGYNNDRSGVTLSSALHPTLGYIDGDFYGPNAEEAAGIFTRGNVNGAFMAKK